MPERSDSDSGADVLALLERASDHAPTMHLPPQDVLVGGQRRRRRRRTLTGAGAAGAALLGALLWLGPVDDLLLGSPDVGPAGQQAEPVTSGQLTAGDGTVYDVSVTEEGIRVEGEADGMLMPDDLSGPTSSLLTEGVPVMFVPDWPLDDPDAARYLDLTAPETTWLSPADAVRVDLPDGRPVVVLTIDPGAPFPTDQFGEATASGEVEEVVVPGLTWERDDAESRESSDG